MTRMTLPPGLSRIAVPAALTIVIVTALIATSGWNRAGEPRQVLTLTERELWLEHPPVASGDDPGLRLRLVFEPRADPLGARAWLTDDRLRALGFALHVPVGSPEAAYVYDRVPARIGWVVFEYDGPAFREIERRRALNEEGREWRGRREPSRLVPVDAGPDDGVLRARYPSGHVIVRADFGVRYDANVGGAPHVYGWVRETIPTSVHVPKAWRGVLDAIGNEPDQPPHGPRPPRYDVDLAVGRLGVPYVVAIRAR